MRLVSGCRVAIYFFAGATCSAGTVSTSAGEAAAVGDELDLVHVLDERVVAGAHGERTLRALERVVLEALDHRLDVALPFLDGVDDHECRVEAVGVNRSGVPPAW
jgi:hypothetical protein